MQAALVNFTLGPSADDVKPSTNGDAGSQATAAMRRNWYLVPLHNTFRYVVREEMEVAHLQNITKNHYNRLCCCSMFKTGSSRG